MQLSLTPPPRDCNGRIIPHDHKQILSEDVIIRRISTQQLVHDDKVGGLRPSSMAFKSSSGNNSSMSVDIEKLIIEADIDPRSYVISHPWIGAVYFLTQTIRDLELQVGFEPMERLPYHGGVWGNFTKGTQNKLLKASLTYIPVPQAARTGMADAC